MRVPVNVGSDEVDFDWLQVLAAKLVEDRRNGLPEPDRLRAIATDAGQRELVQNLLHAFTPHLLPAQQWQDWFEGGVSPREAITVARFSPGDNSGKRKVADAAGVYELACDQVAKARSGVEKARRSLTMAEAELARAEETQARAAAKAQGTILWLLLREISRRVDLVYARGPAAKLIDGLCHGFSPKEADAYIKRVAGLSDEEAEKLDVSEYARAKRAKRVFTALEEIRQSPGLEAELRRLIVDTCVSYAAKRAAGTDAQVCQE